MTLTPVQKLIPKLAIPTIFSMLITSVYNMADTYFVSKISTEASAAVGIIYSLMSMIQAIGFTIGMGSGNYVSRLLGQKNTEEAKKTVSTAFFTSLIVGIIFTGSIFLAGLDSFVNLLGAIDSVKPYARDYAKYILLGAPFMMMSFVLNNQLRAQGNPTLAMVGITVGGILNTALDPMLIFGFDMGISGAALATVLSQIISFVILFIFTNFNKKSIHISFKYFRPSKKIYKEIFYTGMPSFCRQGLASFSAVVLNYAAGRYGAAALSAISIVNRFMLFIYSGLIGFAQGFQPVCGFNFGAKRYDRVLEAFKFCMKVAVVFLAVLGSLAFVFAPQILTFFRKEDAEVIKIGYVALRLQAITLPIQAVAIMTQFLSQSIGYGGRASLVAMARQGLFLFPAYIILPKFFDILGVQLAQPVSDLFTFILSLYILKSVLKNIKIMQKSLSEKEE